MDDISALKDYFMKIQRALDNADFTFFQYKFVKKSRIDDLLVCTLALLPKSFKEATKRKINIDMYPSVACYTRLSKILKKQIGLLADYYVVNYNDSLNMIRGINKNLNRDIKNLEEM